MRRVNKNISRPAPMTKHETIHIDPVDSIAFDAKTL
jgi:hypothetical protein